MPCYELEPVSGAKGTRAGGVSELPVDGDDGAAKASSVVYELAP